MESWGAAEEEGGRRGDNIRPPVASGPTVCVCVWARSQNPNLTHLPPTTKDTYRIFQKITASKSQKQKRIFFLLLFSSNKLSDKPLSHAVSPPSGSSECVVQYRLNFKEEPPQPLPPPPQFP